MFFIQTLKRWWIERSRLIFHFFDGSKWRRADPIKIATAIERECPDYQDLFDTIRTQTKDVPAGPVLDDLLMQQKKAQLRIVETARKVFGMRELDDGGGSTDREALTALAKYLAFMEDLAEGAELFQESPEPESVSPPASASEPSAASTTAGS